MKTNLKIRTNKILRRRKTKKIVATKIKTKKQKKMHWNKRRLRRKSKNRLGLPKRSDCHSL